MGFFDSFKKKTVGKHNNTDKSNSKEETTEQIVDDKVYVRDINSDSNENAISTEEKSKDEINNEQENNQTTQNTKEQEIKISRVDKENIKSSKYESDNQNKVNQTKINRKLPPNVKRSQYAPRIEEEEEIKYDKKDKDNENKTTNDHKIEEISEEKSTEEKVLLKHPVAESFPEKNVAEKNVAEKKDEEKVPLEKDNEKSSNKEQDKKTATNPEEMIKNNNKTLIISILNQKGGVGKSTTAINLAAALGELGKKCLLVDLDPQGNTSSGLGIEKNTLKKCIYDVLLHDTNIEEVIVKDACKGVDVVPATINLAGAEVELVSEIAREQRLKDALTSCDKKYDYIFVDCPPSLGLLTVNALVAANQLIIPIQCEFYALEGVTKLLDSMKRVKNRLNPDLDIYGVVLTMYDNRTTLSKQVAEEVQNFFGEKVFKSKIPRTVKISEAPSFGIPINEYEPLCKGTIMYESLAEEVIERG